MALTNTAKNELLEIMLGKTNVDTPSEKLPLPSFEETGNTNFISEFKLKITDSSNEKIKQINLFENQKIVLIEYTLTGNVENAFAIFNGLNELIYIIQDINNLAQPVKLPNIYDFKLSEDGNIFGFCNGIEDPVTDKIHFFIFNDILSLIGVLSDTELVEETFFSAIVDVESEILDDDKKVTGGNPAFGLIRSADNKYGFNQDEKESDTFSFVVWEKDTKKVTMVKFSTDSVNIDPKNVTYDINEPVALSQGDGLVGSNFDGLSIIDVFTGEKGNLTGSIMFSTQKDAGQNQTVPNQLNISTTAPVSADYTLFSGDDRVLNKTNTKTVPAISNDQMQKILAPVKTLYKTPDNTITDVTGKFIFKTKYNGQTNLEIDITKITMDKLVAATNVEFVFVITWKNYFTGVFTNEIKSELILRIDGNDESIKTTEFANLDLNIFGDDTGKDIYLIKGQHAAISYLYGAFDFSENIVVSYDRIQQTVQENSTSQILIDTSSNKTIYKIIQSENNSYQGTAPVAISSSKWFIPLKSKTTNQYSIYEFNGESTSNSQISNRFYNDIGSTDYTDLNGDSYTKELLSPKTIVNVNIDGTDINKSRYSLAGDIITIKGVKKDDKMDIEYTTLVGEPRIIHIDTTTLGSDMLLASVLDKKELGTISRAIIGAGDNSDEASGVTPTKTFGFNLYKDNSSIDYNQIAEEVEDLIFKVKHVVGARQNDVLYITAYDEDFTKFVSWTQIYPDSFKPFTYLPGINPQKYFVIERISINQDGNRAKTRFDRAILDSPVSGDSLTATTTAKSTDGNNPNNNKQIIYGSTNQPLFEYDKTLTKTSNEAVLLNYNITTNIIDKLEGGEITQAEASERLIKLFAESSPTIYKELVLDKFIITYDDGSTIETDAKPYLTLSNNNSIRAEITLYNNNIGDADDKIPNKLELKNVAGDLIATIDLEKDQCSGAFTNIGFDINITDSTGGTNV